MRTFALKRPTVGTEPANLAYAPHTITQLTKCARAKTAPSLYVLKTERRSAPAGRSRYRQNEMPATPPLSVRRIVEIFFNSRNGSPPRQIRENRKSGKIENRKIQFDILISPMFSISLFPFYFPDLSIFYVSRICRRRGAARRINNKIPYGRLTDKCGYIVLSVSRATRRGGPQFRE